MIKLVVALVLLAHGIGHSMGILMVFNVATVNPAWQGDSWLLSGVAGTRIDVAVLAAVPWFDWTPGDLPA